MICFRCIPNNTSKILLWYLKTSHVFNEIKETHNTPEIYIFFNYTSDKTARCHQEALKTYFISQHIRREQVSDETDYIFIYTKLIDIDECVKLYNLVKRRHLHISQLYKLTSENS